MNFWDVVFIGLGLSMDAVAVTVSNCLSMRKTSHGKIMMMPVFFGVFQAIMPLIGFYSGNIFAGWVSKYAGIAVFVILGSIGGKMLWEGFHPEKESEACNTMCLTYKVLFFQAVATSIDALAVGVGFSVIGASIGTSALIIGATTFFCSFGAIFIGKKFGDLLESKAEVLGGVILLVIGMKALF